MNLNDLFTEEKVRLDPKCWTGKKIGNPKTKMKGGTRVNNCVPAESVNEMDKSQTPPGRDGSNDLDAGKKEYTAKATTAKKVAKDAEKILNKELNKKQGVAEAGGMLGYNKFKQSWRAKHGDKKPVPGYDSKEYTQHIYQQHDKKQNDKKQGVAEGELDEGWKSALGAAAMAGTMALGSTGANARVTPDGQGGFTGGFKPSATVTAPADNKPAAEAPKGFSKEYLQSVVNGTHPRPLISKERAQELLQQQTTNEQSKQQKGADYRDPPEADYGDDYQDMVARVKKLAGLGPLKTVYDPQKRVYRNVPTAVQPKK